MRRSGFSSPLFHIVHSVDSEEMVLCFVVCPFVGSLPLLHFAPPPLRLGLGLAGVGSKGAGAQGPRTGSGIRNED